MNGFTPMLYTKRGKWGEFWNTLQFGLDKLLPWQAKYLLQYMFTAPGVLAGKKPGFAGLAGGKEGTLVHQQKAVISRLTGIASGGTTPEEQNRLKGLAMKEFTGEGEPGQPPPGWKGLQTIMMKSNVPGRFSNPFGSHKGYIDAILSGSIGGGEGYQSATGKPAPVDWRGNRSITGIMNEWSVGSPEELDTIAPIVAQTTKSEQKYNRAQYESKRRSQRGTSGLEMLFDVATSKLLPMAVGGTGFALGGELGGGVGKTMQDLGALMYRGGAGQYPQRWGMDDPMNIWEGPSSILKDFMPEPRWDELPFNMWGY